MNEKKQPKKEPNPVSKGNRSIPNRKLHTPREEEKDSLLARDKKEKSAVGRKVNPIANLLPKNQKENSTDSQNGLSEFFNKVRKNQMQQQPNYRIEQRKQERKEKNQENSSDSPQEEEDSPSLKKPETPLKKLNQLMKPSFLEENEEKEPESLGTKAVKGIGKAAKTMIGAMTGLIVAPAVAILLVIVVIAAIVIMILTPIITSTSVVMGTYSIDLLISEKWGETIVGLDVDEKDFEKDQTSFADRIIDVATEYRENNQEFNPHLVAATQLVIESYYDKFTYRKMTRSVIEELVQLMFDENGYYDEELFKENLETVFLPKYASKVDPNLYKGMVAEIFDHVKTYEETFLDGNSNSSYGDGGSCTYIAPGVNINGTQRKVKINASNIQVQLMQTGQASGHDYGGTFGKPMEGEELIPFEYYAAGCSYQEIGASSPTEAIKTQIVAARSYALVRPFDMAGWRKLENKNGQWILYTAGSTTDQVYCSLEKGCSSSKTTGAADACQWGMVYSGTNHGTVCQGPLASGHKLYQLRDEMAGKVLVDKDGYIIYTGFVSTTQRQWINNASTQDYNQLLLATYASKGAVEVKQMNCIASQSNDYHSWKQEDPRWGSKRLSPSTSTMAEIGCLVTSLSMMASKSKVQTKVTGTLTPGTFLDALIDQNSFNSIGELTSYEKVSKVAPGLKVVNENISLKGTEQEKIAAIKNYLDQGYYIIAQVYSSEIPQHFVFIDGVEGNKVVMVNPSSTYSFGDTDDLFEAFDTNRLILFKKGA